MNFLDVVLPDCFYQWGWICFEVHSGMYLVEENFYSLLGFSFEINRDRIDFVLMFVQYSFTPSVSMRLLIGITGFITSGNLDTLAAVMRWIKSQLCSCLGVCYMINRSFCVGAGCRIISLVIE